MSRPASPFQFILQRASLQSPMHLYFNRYTKYYESIGSGKPFFSSMKVGVNDSETVPQEG